MSDAKTYVFGDSGLGSNALGLLAPLLQQRGLDPNVVCAMMKDRGGDGWGQNGMWWIIILFFLLWGRNGWGNNGEQGGNGYDYLANLINNDKSSDMIMSAVQGNANAISQLAATLNCSVGQVQQAINTLGSNICQVGNQVGLTGQQTINAIQQGNMQITQQLSNCCCDIKTQLSSCCCDIKDGITRSNYDNQIATLNQTNTLQNSLNTINVGQERGFSQLGFTTQQQTCDLQNTFNEGVQKILNGQKAAEMRELSRELAERDRRIAEQAVIINNGQQSAMFGQMINAATAPINAALSGLAKEVNEIECKLPNTVTTPYSPFVAVPNCVAYQYGFNGFNGFGTGNNF